MKDVLFVPITALILLTACSHEIQSPEVTEEQRAEAVENFMMQSHPPTRSLHQHSFTYDSRGKFQLQFDLPVDLARMEASHWQEYDRIVRGRMAAVPVNQREDYYYDFVYSAYRMIFRGLIRARASNEAVQEALRFYLDNLVEFRAPDLYVLYLGLKHLDLAKYDGVDLYQGYCRAISSERIVKYEALLQDPALSDLGRKRYLGQLQDARMLQDMFR